MVVNAACAKSDCCSEFSNVDEWDGNSSKAPRPCVLGDRLVVEVQEEVPCACHCWAHQAAWWQNVTIRELANQGSSIQHCNSELANICHCHQEQCWKLCTAVDRLLGEVASTSGSIIPLAIYL
jgi:hypothetical protein